MPEEAFRILYVDNSADSRRAQELLDGEGIEYGQLPHNPHHFWNPTNTPIPAPVLVAPEGRFLGLNAIMQFATFYKNYVRATSL